MFQLDVEQMLKSRFGSKVPGWLVWVLRRVLHEEWLNGCFRRGFMGIPFCEDSLYNFLNISLDIEGRENLAALSNEKRYTVASNHAMGGSDALAILAIFGRQFDENVKIFVNDFLSVLPQLSSLSVGVNKMSRQQARNLSVKVDEIFSGNSQVLMFPSGKAARRHHGRIQEEPWGKTVISKSVQFQRDIVPMHFYGKNTWRFYFMDWIGKVTGINRKFPLAMILLVDELYRAQGKRYRVVIGEPIPWQQFNSSRRPAEWAEWLREKVISL